MFASAAWVDSVIRLNRLFVRSCPFLTDEKIRDNFAQQPKKENTTAKAGSVRKSEMPPDTEKRPHYRTGYGTGSVLVVRLQFYAYL